MLHAIKVKFLDPVDSSEAHISMKSLWFRSEASVVIPYVCGAGTAYEQAAVYLEKKGFEAVDFALIPDGYLLLSETFKPLRKDK
jgi:hypothetical protein